MSCVMWQAKDNEIRAYASSRVWLQPKLDRQNRGSSARWFLYMLAFLLFGFCYFGSGRDATMFDIPAELGELTDKAVSSSSRSNLGTGITEHRFQV